MALTAVSSCIFRVTTKPSVTFNKAAQESLENFFLDIYREKIIPRRKFEFDVEEVLVGTDGIVEEKIKSLTLKEKDQKRYFYEVFLEEVKCMRRHVQKLRNTAHAGALVEAVTEDLRSIDRRPFDSEWVAEKIIFEAEQLSGLVESFEAQLAPKHPWYNSGRARLFYVALLAFAVGASLHFMPVVGAGLAISMSPEWVALMVNILVPAVAATVTGVSVYLGLKPCFFKPKNINAELDQQIKQGAENLLVQIVKDLLVTHQFAIVKPAESGIARVEHPRVG